MEKSLDLLRREGILRQWSDLEILPGRSISSEIRKQMNSTDIMVFLLSRDFIASEECVKEWNYAREISETGKSIFRIPIIVRPCAWQDFLGNDDVMALPNDGKPVSQFQDKDVAWLQVYEGIKSVVNELRKTFTPKQEYLDEIDKTDFISQSHLKLQDLYAFPRMTCQDPQANEQQGRESTISNLGELLENNLVLIHGEEKSGKTALARHIYLSLVEESQPALLLESKQSPSRITESFIQELYGTQFHGDYSLWIQQDKRTLIVDDVNPNSRSLEYIETAKENFDQIILIASTDDFYAFFRDERRLAGFKHMQIEPLSHVQQENLIRRRLELLEGSREITDGLVDQVEKRVESVIVSEKLLPRYPFYVLSILQTYEAYMPTNLSVTSYGHCYYVLIVANLMRSGISGSDDDVNACFNFAERLAFQIYQHRKQSPDIDFDYSSFVSQYKEKFFIRDAIVSRLQNRSYGLIRDDGRFRTEFMYYYFLGKFLAGNKEDGSRVIEEMCENSHREQNYLTLLFAIHHTNDNSIINDILNKTMRTLDSVPPAKLTSEETGRFRNIIQALPENIMSNDTVEEIRVRERETRDVLSERLSGEDDNNSNSIEDLVDAEPVNGIYRILKNNRIMSQVLRNRHGNLEKSAIEEIIQVIADSGLRLVNLVLADEDEIARLASFIHEKFADWDMEQIKASLQYVSFLWAMINIEQVVAAVNIPEIRVAVRSVVQKNPTPAFDLIGYFSKLESAAKLEESERDDLRRLLRKHEDAFVQRVLSIRTQAYMNAHRSPANIEQSVCDLLKIRYRARLRSGS